MNVPYIPGNANPPELPLGRFLPPIPKGMLKVWCDVNINPGEWVLEPFGFNPLLVIEIASAGYPVLVCVNNPIHAFLLQVLASAPQADELVAALQDLAIISKGDDRMEPYIRSLYQVNCANCQHKIEADAFLWKKDADQPYAAQVECTFCGARGEQPLTAETMHSMTPLPPKQLHVARALNRIAERDDDLRSQVENALNAYPTRPLIILQTIINKLESLEQSPRRRELMIALVLSAADRGNTLWAYPSPRNRPRQIVVPAVYQERNLWKVMEEAVNAWQVIKTPIRLSDWQGVPEEPIGIFKFQGRIRELDPGPPKDFFSAIVTVIPRPNQAFWTLSALWTGWIWGQETMAPIRQVLSRQRYDWNWHAHALMSVFEEMQRQTSPATKVWGLIPENEPMLLLASLLAADSSGFKLDTFAQSLDDQLAQCGWTLNPQTSTKPQPDHALYVAKESAIHYLEKKGEPATYQQIHAAAITGMAHDNKLAIDVFLQNINQATSETQQWIESIFNDTDLLIRISESQASLETGDWWLRDSSSADVPLMDRLEEVVYRHLVNSTTATAEEIKNTAYQALPGIFTPEDELILNCLDSYADPVDPPSHLWRLRDCELPTTRKEDKQKMLQSLVHVADRLNYRVSGFEPLDWYEGDEPTPTYRFHVITSAKISTYIQSNTHQPQTNILVLPGSRANLLAFKGQHNPLLRDRLSQNYLVVKFRLIRDLEVNPLLSRELFREQIYADPPEYRASQLALL